MLSIWDFLQDSNAGRTRAAVQDTQAKSVDLERRIKQLEAEVDSLTLVSMAMWELLGKSNGFFLKDLEAKMQEIDLRDGKLDGKVRSGPVQCANCERMLDERRKTCIYCGRIVSVFDA